MRELVRFRYRDDRPCDLWGEFVGETKQFWKYRSYCTGKVERTAKTKPANIDQGLGRTDWGRFRGNVRTPSAVHFEPCVNCPDWGQAAR